MNGPIIYIARELGFEGNPILEGLVVSIFIVGAFIGSLSSGAIVDKLGCRRTLQISTLPLIVGAILRLLYLLCSMLLTLYHVFLCYILRFLILEFKYSVIWYAGQTSVRIENKYLLILYVCSALAISLDEILLGRFLVGVGIGINTVLVPIYISEVISNFISIINV